MPLVNPFRKPYATEEGINYLFRSLEKVRGFLLLRAFFPAGVIQQISVNLVTINFRSDKTFGTSSIHLPNDDYIGRRLATYGHWGRVESKFLSKLLNKGSIFLDFGAHSGLISMQVAQNYARLGGNLADISFLAVEPLPINLLSLRLNLKNVLSVGQYEICDFALTDGKSGKSPIFTEMGATMNTSLMQDVTGDKNVLTEVKACNSAKFFSSDRFHGNSQIVLKSDLQGMDAVVLSTAELEFWKRVRGGVIEVMTVKDIDCESVEFLLNNMELFFSFSWNTSFRELMDTKAIAQFWCSSPGEPRNLYFIRKHSGG
jgi:FkbM family methyltransferase